MNPRIILSLGNFFLAVSSTLVSYTLISYLSHFVPTAFVGVAIAGGGGMAAVAFLFLPHAVQRFGTQRPAIFLAFIQMLMLFAAAATPDTVASAIFIILVISLQPLLLYELDLLLEATMRDGAEVGRVRTMFLTGGNIGSLTGPLIIGALLATSENYSSIFLAAAAMLAPFIVLFAAHLLPYTTTPSPSQTQDTLEHLTHNRDLAAVTFGHLLLYMFYIWAPLYIPVYLHTILDIPWSTLGWMFSLMLLPYVLVEYPAGWIADRYLGDEKLMLAGFLIAGCSLGSLAFLTPTSSPALIIVLLLATRVGAALIESMTEGHFFRCVSESDIVSVSVFRGVWPLANFTAPLIASVIIFWGSYQLLFILTGGFIAIAGAISAALIRDYSPQHENVCEPVLLD